MEKVEYDAYGDCNDMKARAVVGLIELFLLITSIVFIFKEQFLKAICFLGVLATMSLLDDISKLRRYVCKYLDNPN